MRVVLSAGPGKEVRFGLPQEHWPVQKNCAHAARMLETEAPKLIPRQAGLLAYG
jgi:hypothetical protein